jgi:hypothetical protein
MVGNLVINAVAETAPEREDLRGAYAEQGTPVGAIQLVQGVSKA